MKRFLAFVLLLIPSVLQIASGGYRIFFGPGTKVVKPGDDVDLICNTERDDFNKTWIRNDRPKSILAFENLVLANDSRISLQFFVLQSGFDQYTLNIKNVTYADSGQYECISANQGDKRRIYKLHVKGVLNIAKFSDITETPMELIHEGTETTADMTGVFASNSKSWIESFLASTEEPAGNLQPETQQRKLLSAVGIKAIQMTIEILKSFLNETERY